MQKPIFLVWFILIELLTNATHSKNPGLKSRITSKGFTYAVNVALDVLSKGITHKGIPDQHGVSGNVSYDITRTTITRFKKPASTVTLQYVGPLWKTSNIDIGLHGDFQYKYKKGNIPIYEHGTFDMTGSGITFAINLMIGMDYAGRPTISSRQCSCSVQSTNIKFQGGRAEIYNLFSRKVEKSFKSSIEGGNGLLCKQLTKLVNVDGARLMAQFPVSVPFASKFRIDYSFMSKPAFSYGFMETYHKGEVNWYGNRGTIPFDAPPLPAGSSSSKMLYLWFSDFLFNSMSYTAFSHGLWTYNITDKNIPGGILNTTCKNMCIGKLIPQIGKMFPNSQVMMNLRSSTMPNMTSVYGKTRVDADADIKFYATNGKGKFDYFLTLSANISTTISITVNNEKVFARVLKLPINVNVKDSKIGQLSGFMLDFIVKNIITTFMEPKLNNLGRNGFPLPIIGSVHFANTELHVQQNSLLIATDVKYY
ncbi:lipopolysaccharide-binding protein-like [Crassostrea angulata]|uniref:lipopolysaccharide-binding protein-like n=1 Tax=Magallana angulata TaxID=2784310 RepID=UPI0022B150EA|nr:lipopolysaccharide-binding protein-like [Crassostrea angulata]